MESTGIARFPFPVRGRIPNFEGSERACRNVKLLREWENADVIKCNPDSPQRMAREIALRDGKKVYVAVPRLRDERCFVEIRPSKVRGFEHEASSIKGAFKYGRRVYPYEMDHVDLVICGSVAVDLLGGRVGKSGGFSDLEIGILKEVGVMDDSTPVLTTVHPVQIVERVPMERHDHPVEYIVTPWEIIRTQVAYKKPDGILWDSIGDKVDEVPFIMHLIKNRNINQ